MRTEVSTRRAKPPGRRSRRPLIAAIAGLAMLAAAIGVSLAGAAAPSLQDKIDSANSDADQLSGQIEEQSARIAGLEQRARAAGAREMELSAQIEVTAARSRELAGRLTAAEEELDRVRVQYKQAVGVLSDRLVEIYKGSEPDELTVLLQSDGFDELQSRAEYLQALHDADRTVAEEVAEFHAQVEAHYDQIAGLKADIDEQARQLEAAHTEFASVRAEAEKSASELADARSSAQSSLSAVQDRVAELEEQQMEASGGPAFSGGPYAIPTYIVMCESGGNYHALNSSSGAGGAYQILPSTWRAYGGRGLPHQAPKAEQDRIAGMIWRDSGPSAWSCA